MKRPELMLVAVFVFSLLAHAAEKKAAPKPMPSMTKSTSCEECTQLHKIYLEYKPESEKPKPDFNSLQKRASQVILEMGKKHPKLSQQEAASVAEVFRVAVPLDPGRSIVENTYPVLSSNREAIETEVKKLPAHESETILQAMANLLDPDKTPGQEH